MSFTQQPTTYYQNGVPQNIITGASGAIAEVDHTFKTLRTTSRPVDAVGEFGFSATTGLLNQVAAGSSTAGHIFALRGTSGTTLILIRKLTLSWQTITAFATGQQIGLQAFIARSFTAAGSGGTAITASGAGGFKRRASLATSVITDARISTTGALTAGTMTLDAQPILELNGFSQTGAAPAVMPVITTSLDLMRGSTYPLVLSANEGLIVRNTVALVGVAGTAVATVNIIWDEVSSY